MTHLLIEYDLQTEIEAKRMELRRDFDDQIDTAAEGIMAGLPQPGIANRERALMAIALLTLGLERGVIR